MARLILFPLTRCFAASLACGFLLLVARAAGTDDDIYELPPFATYSEQVANQTPVASFAMPVSGLRFEPRVDVQARNLPEGQADISIRGGIFENTGFKLGALSLFDPQTGHYLAELPVAPAMLRSPTVLTGADNALGGFNAEVGTVAYGWRPIEARGEAAVAFGDYASNRQSLYQGFVLPGEVAGQTAAADVDFSRSVSDGSVPFGDHDFKRASGRFQLRGAQSQTDFFAGSQQKFFGWPDLYTPFGTDETEDLHTQLYLVNHRAWSSAEDYWEVGAYYRRNYDDYEYDRKVPGEFNPYQHTTRVQSASLEGHQSWDRLAVTYHAEVMRDSLESTALVYGRFNTRDYLKLAAVPEYTTGTAWGAVKLRAGATYDETNRDGAAVSPIVAAELARPDHGRYYLQYAGSSQVATYTALNSSPNSGLFRGNPNLGRERSRNLEAGTDLAAGGWKVEAAVFYRQDHNLVDWTYVPGVTARTANAVDVDTFGVEVVATRKTTHYDLVLGYTHLEKSADYHSAAVGASFYALNFPRERLTAAAVVRLGAGFEARLDNQYRVEEKNLLRTVGGNDAFLSTLGVYYLPPRLRGLEFSVLVDNLWNSSFEEVPAVPAARREFSAGAAYRW